MSNSTHPTEPTSPSPQTEISVWDSDEIQLVIADREPCPWFKQKLQWRLHVLAASTERHLAIESQVSHTCSFFWGLCLRAVNDPAGICRVKWKQQFRHLRPNVREKWDPTVVGAISGQLPNPHWNFNTSRNNSFWIQRDPLSILSCAVLHKTITD